MSTWLTAIVFNSALMHLRKRSRLQHISLEQPVSEGQECNLSEYLSHPGLTPEEEYRNSEISRL